MILFDKAALGIVERPDWFTYTGNTMKFFYNPRKAAQTAAFLVRLNGGRMDVFSLIKVLYLSDRRALVERGRPITGDVMVSMPHGPVLSRIYDEIKAPAEVQDESWSKHLKGRDENMVSLREQNPASDELSDYERAILTETHSNYAHYGPMELRAITHRLPEYVDPQGSSIPIDPVKILREEGWSDEEIEEALMSAREEIFLAGIANTATDKVRA